MTEDLVEKARMAECAERFEDMARVRLDLKLAVIITIINE